MNYRYCLGQDGLALQRNVDTLLLAVKQADGQTGASPVTSDVIGSGSAAFVGQAL